MLVNKATLLSQLAPPLDSQLAQQLLDEFISQERRFIQRDWEPSQLDAGQFCEVMSRILYHMDSGSINAGKDGDECLKYIENPNAQHLFPQRHTMVNMAKVTRAVYKLRSTRGAIHISPTYKANHMDSKLVLEGVRWLFSETLRVWWSSDKEQVA